MSRRLTDSINVTLDATAGEDSHLIAPHGFYLDAATDEIWFGSGVIESLTVEASGSGVVTTVEIHDARDTNGRIIHRVLNDGTETFTGIRDTTYGGYLHDTGLPAEFGEFSRLWAQDIVGTQTAHFPDLDIVCPFGMVILVAIGTVAADEISVTYEPWTAGASRYRNRNKSKPLLI